MKVFEESFQLRLPKSEGRSKGLHLSDIIRDLSFKTDVMKAKYDKQITDVGSELIQIGLAWENYLAEYQHPEICFHASELLLDGIAMSPDGISVVDYEDLADRISVEEQDEYWILHEFKATRKSSRNFKQLMRERDKKALMWLWQVESYRHAINKLYPHKACYISKLHILFINGNYSWKEGDPESGPTYHIYRIVHTPEELEDTWDLMKQHAATMKEESEDGTA